MGGGTDACNICAATVQISLPCAVDMLGQRTAFSQEEKLPSEIESTFYFMAEVVLPENVRSEGSLWQWNG